MNVADMSIKEIRLAIEKMDEVPKDFLQLLKEDQRAGVQALARQQEAAIARQEKLAAMWTEMTSYERALREKGHVHLFGIDEVGRGPLAGPVVACAVCLPEDFYLPGLNDSKKIPVATREAFYEVIVRDALAIGVGIVDAARIDEINILQATKEAMKNAIDNAAILPDACLIDAVQLSDLPCEQVPIIGGDAKSVSIAAASIVAKVTRDRMMAAYANEYPAYGFEKNAGYGTAEHLSAIARFGPTPIHRMTFTGVKEQA
ncbi:ribonuclease HII [Brevibacillus reuszeri]|uniref:Ribonuclease HII n=1 Tax=Brevibacillus reuszeri TaxID=54915 RepID=A0A0K9YVL8_9BACL|nr:ribonuclease HII [Brevibacillus reuszeri]KNB72697.1 ribonuclease H [Brevibacillus reuszeri]MED1860604.1 ribonuclease HII [Brevibacillus reuszeri]GED70272.1 ribonuclease HII [Brevibacillus reuszeri]